jgi:hypothetical protein
MDLDPGMVSSLRAAWADREQAIAENFTIDQELLAQILELLSVVRVEALSMGGLKKSELPDVIRVPRPGVEPEDPIPTISPREFSLMMAG